MDTLIVSRPTSAPRPGPWGPGMAIDDDHDVWITGVGASTPLGDGFDEIAGNLLDGRSGVRSIDEFPVDDQPSRIAGRVGRIACPEGWDAHEFEARRPLERLVMSC